MAAQFEPVIRTSLPNVTATILDAGTAIVDSTDPTKAVAFEISSVSTGTTRTITVPDTNITLAGTGTLVKSVAGGAGTTTLTSPEFAANSAFDLTGAITGNRVLEIPTGISKTFIIDNATTGAFTVTVKHSATAGIVVAQGTRQVLYTDGVTVENVTSGAATGLSVTAGKTLSVSNTLTLAGTDGTAMTFPATSATIARTDAANTFTGIQSFSDMVKLGRGVQVASAAALPVTTDGNYYNVTGTTGITSIATMGATGTGGAKGILPMIMLKFDGVLTITHNAASLILPNAENITTYAGMVLTFVEESSTVWRCIGEVTATPSVSAYLTAAETLADNTYVQIGSTNGWTEIYDTHGFFDNGTGATSGKFLPTIPGRYLVILTVAIGAAATIVLRAAHIRKNGLTYTNSTHPYSNSTTDYSFMQLSDVIQLNGSTDYLTFWAVQDDSGGTSRTLANGDRTTSVQIIRLGD